MANLFSKRKCYCAVGIFNEIQWKEYVQGEIKDTTIQTLRNCGKANGKNIIVV